MKILLTNDDGIMADGIYILAKELEKEHDITIVAPETQKSAQSHAITLHRPLIIKEVKLNGLKSKAYSISEYHRAIEVLPDIERYPVWRQNL